MKIYRVRELSCDGGRIGRVWLEKFFMDPHAALKYLQDYIVDSDRRNPKYPFKKEPEEIDGVYGYCNWQFGTMISTDMVRVQESE